MNLISVIIPVYNTAEYLPRCLDSVLNNTYRHLEVICIDDGSTDGTAEILQEYAKKDSRIVIITQKNSGVSAARNAGLDRASGDYIAFVDSDDWIHIQYFELLLDGLLENDADIAICCNTQTEDWIDDADIFHEKASFKRYKGSCTPTVKSDIERYIWGRIYTRTLISERRFALDVKLAEDSLFNLELFCSKNDITYVVCEETLYYYFVRWSSASHKLGGKDLKPLIMWYLNKATLTLRADQDNASYIYEAIKALLSWRYGAILTKNRDDLLEIKGFLRTASDLLWRCRQIPIMKKLLYASLTAMPFLYRLFRLLTDPTMMRYERRIKLEQKASK